MLQQTQVKTALPYFKNFLLHFPDLESLSKSNERKVLKLWEGLGYYRRARNLLATSKIIVKEHSSKLPKKIIDIKKLPGIGEYTANALSAFIHNQPTIAIDGNVKRVFSRIVNKNENKIDFNKLIETNKKSLFKTKRHSDFVEALMEFGALICKPKNPKCKICNLKITCKYFNSSNKIKTIKNKMIKNKNYDVFCYMNNKKQIALTKKNNLGFLNKFNLPEVKETSSKERNEGWRFLNNYKNSISNIKLNINLYYKFSTKIPPSFNWYSIDKNKEFIPSFTKKIFKKVSILF